MSLKPSKSFWRCRLSYGSIPGLKQCTSASGGYSLSLSNGKLLVYVSTKHGLNEPFLSTLRSCARLLNLHTPTVAIHSTSCLQVKQGNLPATSIRLKRL